MTAGSDAAEAAIVGVIAGDGDLPRLIAEDRRSRGLDYMVCAFEGAAPV